MRRRIEIESMERETFYRYKWKGGRGTPVPGTETKAFRIRLLMEGPGEQTWVQVRRDTRALAVAAAKELLGLSAEQWARMLECYKIERERVRELVRAAKRKQREGVSPATRAKWRAGARRLSKSLRPG